MKILVNATANDSRGPFSITDSFLYEMSQNQDYLRSNSLELYIIVSRKELCKYNSEVVKVKYINFPKKSMVHKWIFENIVLPRKIKKLNFGVYLSLQNLGLNRTRVKQYVLIHTPLPFSDLKLKDIEIKNYIKYRILLKSILKKQISKMNGIIVQTHWMEEAIRHNFPCNGKIKVIRPQVEDIAKKNRDLDENLKKILDTESIKLFYPTNKEKYKNNERVLEAVKLYNRRNTNKIKLIITLDGDSNKDINYVSRVEYESMFNIYKAVDALIFPSLNETLGLPLIEAKQANLPRLVSDLPYAREICGETARYFNPFSIEDMIRCISEFIKSKDNLEQRTVGNSIPESSYMDYIEFILEDYHK
ncbi:MAG: glycosyltransferase [Heyndrickxia oleronia]|jgi:glycosyltransferase involved in cell wall biosynthesis|uniref:glycosyltransferase n=1 Tax=Heyndrickxia oleronia TaxID=38875 RepID=UPI00242CCBB3|nr:glycosyltransferase [Heyndrickxia oleronia]MCI1593394.1 glycosyltransferase [Heyndrickxia oleronia]